MGGASVAVTDPQLAAATGTDWPSLDDVVRRCVACPMLAGSRRTVVPGVGPPGARLLLVGEAPGAAEDESGLPFVGRSGQLLDTLLAAAGLDRARVAIANTLKCRPPGNRAPRRDELDRCRPWLSRQIEVLDPAVIVTLGTTAAGWFLGPGARIGVLRARDDLRVGGRRLLVTYHPSAALRFGPAGEPAQALAADLARAAAWVTGPA